MKSGGLPRRHFTMASRHQKHRAAHAVQEWLGIEARLPHAERQSERKRPLDPIKKTQPNCWCGPRLGIDQNRASNFSGEAQSQILNEDGRASEPDQDGLRQAAFLEKKNSDLLPQTPPVGIACRRDLYQQPAALHHFQQTLGEARILRKIIDDGRRSPGALFALQKDLHNFSAVEGADHTIKAHLTPAYVEINESDQA